MLCFYVPGDCASFLILFPFHVLSLPLTWNRREEKEWEREKKIMEKREILLSWMSNCRFWYFSRNGFVACVFFLRGVFAFVRVLIYTFYAFIEYFKALFWCGSSRRDRNAILQRTRERPGFQSAFLYQKGLFLHWLLVASNPRRIFVVILTLSCLV